MRKILPLTVRDDDERMSTVHGRAAPRAPGVGRRRGRESRAQIPACAKRRRGLSCRVKAEARRTIVPLGGYCTQCGRWVWLTSYGECQNGHPPASVKDVQQLKPQPTDVVVTSVEPPSAPRARFRWWWRHSLWIGWTFSLGFLNWVSFVYIGIKARKPPWTALGFVYLIPLVLTILAWGTPLLAPMIALQLVASAGSFVNALYLRPHYRAIMFGDAPQAALPAPPQPPPLLTAGERPALPKGMDERAADVLQPARRQVDAILQSAGSINKPAVRDEVIALCRTADQIIAELAARPRKLDAARERSCDVG